MDWKPDEYSARMLEAILSMTTDSLAGRGVDTAATFVANLRTYAKLIERNDEAVKVKP